MATATTSASPAGSGSGGPLSASVCVRVMEGRPSAYDVTIGRGILSALPAELRRLAPKASTFVVVTDDVVERLHWPVLRDAVAAAGWPVHHSTNDAAAAATAPAAAPAPAVLLFSLGPGGEQSKTRAAKARLEDFMLAAGCLRDCVVVALGGGTVGDLAGFAAATFMRGVAFVQAPTTLLAAVDASVGGKTAVNTPAGKNLVGAFHQPLAVWVDLALLDTLPRRHVASGLAEAVKMAACLDAPFFAELERAARNGELLLAASPASAEAPSSSSSSLSSLATSLPPPSLLLQRVVQRSVELKAAVVVQDERDRGVRAVLNWGHTVGHALEALLEPRLLHGECVAAGCVLEAAAAAALGGEFCAPADVERVAAVMGALGLPTGMPTEATVTELERSSGGGAMRGGGGGGGGDDDGGDTGGGGRRGRERATQPSAPSPLPLDVAAVLARMEVDKKNADGAVKCVLLRGIGSFAANPVARPVPRATLLQVMEEDYRRNGGGTGGGSARNAAAAAPKTVT